MRWSEKIFAPTDRVLRQFAGLWLLVFGAWGAWQVFGRGREGLGLGLAAIAAVGALGVFRPRVVRPIFVGWSVVAFPIGWTMSMALLAVVYYGLITPLAVAMRFAGRDELRLRRRPGVSSYWTPKPAPAGVRQYFHQY